MGEPRFVEQARFPAGGPLAALALRDDGRFVAASMAPEASGPRVRVFDTTTGALALAFGADAAWSKGAAFATTNGHVWAALTTPRTHDVQLVRTPLEGSAAGTAEIVHTYGARERFFGLVTGPRGAQIGTVGDSVDVWSAGPTTVVDHAEPAAPGARMAAALGNDGVWLSGAVKDQVVYKAIRGEVLARLDSGGLPPIAVLCPSPDDAHLLARSDGVRGLRLWNTKTGASLHEGRWGKNSRNSLWAWTSDSAWLVTASVGFFAFRATDQTLVEGPAIPKSVELASARSAPVLAAGSDTGVITIVRFE